MMGVFVGGFYFGDTEIYRRKNTLFMSGDRWPAEFPASLTPTEKKTKGRRPCGSEFPKKTQNQTQTSARRRGQRTPGRGKYLAKGQKKAVAR
ncbi:MAG: hypothetical protein PHC30_10445 [Lentisphaeria bacterium]|nr:hypothetical protein [Lentisphaeria bacterium]